MQRSTGQYHCHRSTAQAAPAIPRQTGAAVGYAFPNCTEARAAGYSNIPIGGYGYGPHLDRDGDGIACER